MIAIIEPRSPQWHAWLDHYRQIGNKRRARVATKTTHGSRA
jgi:hypothetical protein